MTFRSCNCKSLSLVADRQVDRQAGLQVGCHFFLSLHDAAVKAMASAIITQSELLKNLFILLNLNYYLSST